MNQPAKGKSSSAIPTSTWEFFGLARDVLGTGSFWRIFGVEKSQVSRWAVNPDAAADHQRNPLDRLAQLFRLMADSGEREAVVARVADLARIVGMELVEPEQTCRPEHPTIEQELLDVHPACVEHAQAIRRDDGDQAVEAWEREAIRQIKQATAAYREKRTGRSRP